MVKEKIDLTRIESSLTACLQAKRSSVRCFGEVFIWALKVSARSMSRGAEVLPAWAPNYNCWASCAWHQHQQECTVRARCAYFLSSPSQEEADAENTAFVCEGGWRLVLQAMPGRASSFIRARCVWEKINTVVLFHPPHVTTCSHEQPKHLPGRNLFCLSLHPQVFQMCFTDLISVWALK